MILTNKFRVEYNMENIAKDFDVFIVTKESKRLDSTNILDIPTAQYKARSVQYTYGKDAFVLFAKGAVEEEAFRQELQDEYKDVKVQKADIMDEAFCKKYFYYQYRILAQLLLNSIRAPKSEKFEYNNLTGKLFYSDQKWKIRNKSTREVIMMYFLQISFDPGMFLNLDVKTFRKNSYGRNKRFYVIDHKTKNFRRKVKTDDFQDTYAEGSFKNRHITVPYLDFSSFEKFKCCKLGILERFLQDVKKQLGDYMTMVAETRDDAATFEFSKKEKAELTNNNFGEILNGRGVYIVDLNDTDKSHEMLGNLVYELQHFYGVEPKIGCMDETGYNIRIIHNEAYYEDNDIPDPHKEDLHGMIVQHMTEEQNLILKSEDGKERKKASPAVDKIVQELILKGDVRDEMISIFNWQKLDSDKEWVFVMREKIREEFEKGKEAFDNAAGNKTYDHYDYYKVKVYTDGSLEFNYFQDYDMAEDEEIDKILFAYDSFHGEQKRINNTVEGLVYSDIDNIHAIILTKEKTMPNIKNLWNGLQETDVRGAVLRDELIEMIEVFAEEQAKYEDYCKDLSVQLKSMNPTVTKDEVKRLMNLRCDAAKALNRYMHNNFGIWISPEIKDTAFETDYLLENVLNIKYFEKYDEYKGEHSSNYYVGPKRPQLQSSIHNASAIRQVLSTGVQIEFQELIPLMPLEFVRNNQYPVSPFPFKFLRVYLNCIG